MSLTTFKKKAVLIHGTKRSGRAPGGIWLPQGPFGPNTINLENTINRVGLKGFSLNGGHRNKGGVGTDMKMSKSGTPYRGTYPVGWGGTHGKYPSATLIQNDDNSTGVINNYGNTQALVQPVLNSQKTITQGEQFMYIKPSVLSSKGMMRQKYKSIYTGTYPQVWVQPNNTGNLTDNNSQSIYLQQKMSQNVCSLKVNNDVTYVGNDNNCGPNLCKSGRSTAGFKYNDLARNGQYTKILNNPVTYYEYNLFKIRKCTNPKGPQKPFPFAVQTGTGLSAAGVTLRSFGNACNVSNNVYLTPPEWYIREK
jgi:hypothetical protein